MNCVTVITINILQNDDYKWQTSLEWTYDILYLGVACHRDPEHVTQFTKHQTNNTCRTGADHCGYMTLDQHYDVMLLLQ